MNTLDIGWPESDHRQKASSGFWYLIANFEPFIKSELKSFTSLRLRQVLRLRASASRIMTSTESAVKEKVLRSGVSSIRLSGKGSPSGMYRRRTAVMRKTKAELSEQIK